MALPDRRLYPDLDIFLRELEACYQDPALKPSFPPAVNINLAVSSLPELACIKLKQTNLAKGLLCSELQATQVYLKSHSWDAFFRDASREFNS